MERRAPVGSERLKLRRGRITSAAQRDDRERDPSGQQHADDDQ
jgi:hypothetical protein